MEDLTFSFKINSSDEDQSHSWPAAALQLHLPTGPLPESVDGKVIHLSTRTRGSFRFPPNTKPVSAIFKISAAIDIEATLDLEHRYAKLELEHCYRGDLSALAFVHCESYQPPYDFKIASQEEYEYSFTLSHGTIKTGHFCWWTIVVTKVKDVVYGVLGGYGNEEDIMVASFFQEQGPMINLAIVFLKKLAAHYEVIIVEGGGVPREGGRHYNVAECTGGCRMFVQIALQVLVV